MPLRKLLWLLPILSIISAVCWSIWPSKGQPQRSPASEQSSGLFPKHSTEPASFPRRQGEDELYRNMACEWVEYAEDNAPVVNQIYAFPIRECGYNPRDGKAAGTYVCMGTARCNGSIQTSRGSKDLSFFIEGVMCVSRSQNCQAARDCALEGGALEVLGQSIRDGQPGDRHTGGESRPVGNGEGK